MIATLRPLLLLLALATPLLADSAVEKRQSGYASQFIIRNMCPAPVNLYIGSQFDSTLPVGGNTTKFSYVYTDFFFTDANGGNANGAGTTRAGFFDVSTFRNQIRAGRVRFADFGE